MRLCAASLAVLVAAAASAAPAAAQGGAGLYEPFPEPTDPKVVRDFVEDMPPPGPELARVLTNDQFRRGFRVALPAATAGGSAARADPAEGPGGALGWLGAAAVMALAGAAAVRLARR